MPIVQGTLLTTRKANTVMSSAFMARAKEWLWPKICGSYITTNLVEPHVIGGAAPPLRRYGGQLSSTGLPSWTLTIPNHLNKNLLEIDRTELEGDQTRTLIRKADEMGIALADYPEQLWTSQLLKGGLTSSATETFQGVRYNVTMDGLPFFSSVHQLDGITSQSNIIVGNLPATVAGIDSLGDITAAAALMQKDLRKIVATIKQIKNNQNMPIFPTLDIRKNIAIVYPSDLEVVAGLAFRQSGVMGGANGTGGSSGSTDTIAPMFVKETLSSGYLSGGWPDPVTGAILQPAYPTSYYVFLLHDRVKPFYAQLFKPPANSDLFPPGYDADKVIAEAIKEGGGTVTRDMATYFASSIVEHNLGAVGSNATRDVVELEKHFISARWRGNFAFGPWICAYRVDPVGSSGG